MFKIPTEKTATCRSSTILLESSLYAVLFGFSLWLMFKTFSYDYQNNVILISHKIWSDFAANLPLIRSFSFGDNWPPEYPIFPGQPIQYHFLFFYLVGKLEHWGVPIHWALNIPSALGFFAILAMIYTVAKRLFHDRRVGLLSVVFFLFNGSLSFRQFFEKHPLSASTLTDIVTTPDYSAMGPWDGGKVLGFWHLNVFINQRHFSVALGVLMVFLFVCLWLENRSHRMQLICAVPFGIAAGLLTLFHKPVTLIFAVTMLVFFVVLPYLRLFLLVMGVLALATMGLLSLMSLSITGPAATSFAWYPGFTVHDAHKITEVLSFFWFQFGLHGILIPTGFFLAPARVKVFMLPALLVFIIAFTFKFAPDVMVNHKFINFSLIVMQMLSAYTLIRAWDLVRVRLESLRLILRWAGKLAAGVAAGVVISVITLSGVIDLFAIVNTYTARIPDVKADSKARWFHEHTPKDAVVLNSSFLYHPASIAGRKIFLGWPYFTVGAGYNHDARLAIVKTIYAGNDPKVFCPLLTMHNISYLTVEDTTRDKNLPPVNQQYFLDNFPPNFLSSDGKYAIYSTATICGQPMPG